MSDRVTTSHAKARAWKPHPSARPYRIPADPPTVKVRLHGDAPPAPLKAPHWPFKRYVTARVAREMKGRGHCVIRAVPEDGLWKACEGSHRIAVAAELGVVIDLQPVGRYYRLQHDNPALGVVTAGQIIDVGPEIRGPEALYRMEVMEVVG